MEKCSSGIFKDVRIERNSFLFLLLKWKELKKLLLQHYKLMLWQTFLFCDIRHTKPTWERERSSIVVSTSQCCLLLIKRYIPMGYKGSRRLDWCELLPQLNLHNLIWFNIFKRNVSGWTIELILNNEFFVLVYICRAKTIRSCQPHPKKPETGWLWLYTNCDLYTSSV